LEKRNISQGHIENFRIVKIWNPNTIIFFFFSDVNYLTNSAPPAAAEWSSLLRPLRGREPEGMWNLLSIVREMYRRCDRNAVRLLEIITEECMSCDQILVWWFQTKLSLLMGSNGYSGGKHNNTHSNSNASQHACSSLCDEIVVLWRLAALNPGLAPDERDMLHSQFTTWHLKILERVVKCRSISTSYSSKYNPHSRSDAELFVGFKPAIEACYLDWEDYPIVGITHNQEANPIFHSPFTCFKHHTLRMEKLHQTLLEITSTDGHGLHGHLKSISNSFRDRYGNSSNSSSDSQEIGGVSEAGPSSSGVVVDGGAVGDGNRSSASSEGFCENEDFGGDSSSGNNLEGAVGFVTNKMEAVDLSCVEDQDQDREKIATRTPESESSQGSLELSTSLAHAAALSLLRTTSGCNLVVDGEYEEDVDREQHPNTLNVNSSSKNVVNSNCSFSGTSSGGGLTSSHASFSSVSSSISSTSLAPSVLPLQPTTSVEQPAKEDMSFSSSSDEFNSPVEISQDKEDNAAITPTPTCSKTLEMLPQPSTSVAAIASSSGRSSISNDILLARAEGLHAHGHGRDACILAVRLAEEMLANPPNLMIELPPTIPKRKGKKMNINPISHQLSALASSTLSKCAFLCTVLSENSEHYHLAFRVCLFALEMPRPPASTKPLEVKLANQESDLLALLKKIPLNPPELKVIRERAEQLRAGTLKSRGEALLPINLASFIFDALVMPSVSGKDNRNRVMSLSYRLPTDENLGFEAAVAALGLKANFSEAEYPLLCEGTRRQRGELALTLLSYYKDEPVKIARIMEKLLDRDIHVLIKSPLLPAYYSNNPPVRSAARREENEVANLHYSSNPEMFANDYGSVGGNSRPHSSTSAELSMSPAASSLACQSAPSDCGNTPSTPGVSGSSTRPKDSRFKGKRAYPSIPNQPSEASAHFMFELAKNVLTKAGGTSSTSLFTQATTSQNHHGPHRGLHMCAFQLGLFSLGLHNCVSPNWLSRTYSSHVSWIMGQAMEIGGPAISFLVDTWEGHLTPPEAANMADRASRGWDNTMIYPSAELALSVLPHAAALNPNEIQRAIIQCKENSDYMLERSCIIVENAAKGGGVYPEVLFQVARYWYELYLRNCPASEQEHDINDVDHSVSISLSALIESQDTGAGPCPPVVVTSAPPPFQQGVAAIAPINLAHTGYHNPYTYCQAAGIYHHHNHHNLTYPANPHQMQIATTTSAYSPPFIQFPPGPAGPPNQPPPPTNQGPQQVFPQAPNFPQGYPTMPCNAAQIQQNMQQFYALAQVPNSNNQPNRHPGVVAGPGVYPQFGQPQQVQQATVRQRHPHQYTPTQMRYLIAAYNAGMLAMETLARRVHDDRPQAKYARNPPYGEDVKWLLRISKKLGTQYLHQFCLCAVNSLVSPFVLHDVAIESAHYLGRNNPQSAMQHLRSVLTPIVQKCQQMYIQCIHQKLYHLTQSDYEEFASIILAARAAFQITPEGNAQFKDWLQSIKRLDAVNSLTEIIAVTPSQPSSTSSPSTTSSSSSTATTPISPAAATTSSQALYAHSFQSFCDITTPNRLSTKQNLNLPQQVASTSQQIFPAMFAIAAGQQAGTPIDLIVDFTNFTVLSMPPSTSSLTLPPSQTQQVSQTVPSVAAAAAPRPSSSSAHEQK
uniref:Zinc finger SWIM domain-containing protein 8 n=1 Tax=Megaselia scalaris TaxID=36166 RepID=T1GJQ2_MEGSC